MKTIIIILKKIPQTPYAGVGVILLIMFLLSPVYFIITGINNLKTLDKSKEYLNTTKIEINDIYIDYYNNVEATGYITLDLTSKYELTDGSFCFEVNIPSGTYFGLTIDDFSKGHPNYEKGSSNLPPFESNKTYEMTIKCRLVLIASSFDKRTEIVNEINKYDFRITDFDYAFESLQYKNGDYLLNVQYRTDDYLVNAASRFDEAKSGQTKIKNWYIK